MFDLTGMTALVTGASGGIGAAIARGLHEAGAAVVLSGTRTTALEETQAAIGERAHIVTCDLADEEAAAGLVAAAAQLAGPIDIVVNNAGITRDNLALRMKTADWHDVIGVNLTAGFMIARAAMRSMMKRRFGRIIGITSVIGVTGNPGQANYAAAKAGMIGMSKSLAHELAGRGITVNCVAPGYIETAMTDAIDDRQRQAIIDRIPAGRIGQPEDIAAAVVWLASREAAYVTGQTLHVNGGMAMV